MTKKHTRKRKHTRRSRIRRHYRGGELLRFHYTADPKRVAWIEALYPYSSQIASIPGLIPWNKYSYDGKTIVNLRKTGLDTLLQIKASADEIPYVIGGGAACELYNAKFKKLGGPNIHETVDPTADVDIFLQEPSISIAHFSNNLMYSTITGVYKDTNTLTPLYDDYTHWVFEHLVNILGTFASQMPSPRFLVPTEESISKLVNSKVDLQTRVGNILILRQTPDPKSDGYIKIQCITTVQTKEGLQVTDHFCEFLLAGGIEISPYKNEILAHSLEDIPGISVPSLFVERPAMLINTQEHSFDERKDREDKTKAKNHYGRIIFLYKLGLFLQANKYNTGTLYEGNYYSEDGLVDLKKRLGNI